MTGRVRCQTCGWESPPVADRTVPYWVGAHAAHDGCPVDKIEAPGEAGQ